MMKVLALETTERVGSVALFDGSNLLLEMQLDPKKRSAESLAPAMQAALTRGGWRPSDVDLVATTVGPGSFTGLRVGVTTAKAFAYSVRADILGVGTLDTIASAVPAEVQRLSVAVDAQRGQVVAGLFRREGHAEMQPQGESVLVDVQTWLNGLDEDVAVTGPVLRKIFDQVPDRVRKLAPQYWCPCAGAVARLAARHYAEGRRNDLWNLVPRYSRRSAAEEKWEARGR